MKILALAAVLTAVEASADGADPIVANVSLSAPRGGLLGLASGARTHRVYVTIESDNPRVELQRVAGMASGYVAGQAALVVTSERICRAPCNELVDVSDVTDFYVGGEGVTASRALDLSQYGDSVKLKVKAGSVGRRSGGIISLTGGLACIVSGGALAGTTALIGDTRGPFMPIGLVTAAVGVVLTVVSVFLLRSAGTDVDLSQGLPPPSARPGETGETTI